MEIDNDNNSEPEPVEGTTPVEDQPEGQEDTSTLAAESPEGAESNKEGDPEPKGKSRLQKLIDSKGGDEDKFVDGIYQTWNSMSRMQAAIDELKQLVAQRQNPEPEPLDTNPDYQWLKTQIGTLDEELAESDAVRQGYAKEFASLKTELAVLQRTNGDAKEIRACEQEMAKLDRDYRKSLMEDKRIAREKAHYERQLKQAEAHIQTSREKQKLEEKYNKAEVEAFRQEFDSAVLPVLKESGLSGKEQTRIYKAIKAEAAEYLEANGVVPSLGALGLELVQDWLSSYKVRAFKEVSEQKDAAAKPPAPKPKPASPQNQIPKPSPKPQRPANGKLSADEARAITERWARS